MVPKNLRPLLPYFKKYRGGLALGALCVLLTNGIWIQFPRVIQYAVDGLRHGVTEQKLLGPAIMYSANTVVYTVGALAYMLKLSPKVTLYAFLPLPVASIVVQYFGRQIH